MHVWQCRALPECRTSFVHCPQGQACSTSEIMRQMCILPHFCCQLAASAGHAFLVEYALSQQQPCPSA